MKKKIFMACAALVVSAAAVVGVKAYNRSQMSDLALANIEALSNPENSITIYATCKRELGAHCEYQCKKCKIVWYNSCCWENYYLSSATGYCAKCKTEVTAPWQ